MACALTSKVLFQILSHLMRVCLSTWTCVFLLYTFDLLDRNTKLVWPRKRFLHAARFEKYHPLYHGSSADDSFLFIGIFSITYIINVGVRLI